MKNRKELEKILQMQFDDHQKKTNQVKKGINKNELYSKKSNTTLNFESTVQKEKKEQNEYTNNYGNDNKAIRKQFNRTTTYNHHYLELTTHAIDDQNFKLQDFKDFLNTQTIHQKNIKNVERVPIDQINDEQKFRILVSKYENKTYSIDKGQEIFKEGAKIFENQQIQTYNPRNNEYKDIFNCNKDLNKIFVEQKFFQIASAFKYKGKIMNYLEKIKQYNPQILLRKIDKEINREKKQELVEKRRRIIKRLSELMYTISKLGLKLENFKEFVVYQAYQIKDSKKFIQMCKDGNYFELIQMLDIKPQFIMQYDFNENRGLHWAAKNSHLKLVELLILRGSNIEAANNQGLTALYFPTEKMNILMIRVLYQYHTQLLFFLGAKTKNYDKIIFNNWQNKPLKPRDINLIEEIKQVYRTARNVKFISTILFELNIFKLRIKLVLLDRNQRAKLFIVERLIFIKGIKQFQYLADENYEQSMSRFRPR